MREVGSAILLLLLPLIFFWAQTIGGQTLIPADALYQFEPHRTYREVVSAPDVPQNGLLLDLAVQNYQWKSFIRQQLAIGEVPLWNPHQFAGIPFLAAGQHSALYPLSAIYYALPLPSAYGWFTVINLWLAGLFMSWFARSLGIGKTGSLLSGVIYQFNGFVIASVVFPMMIGGVVWLPLILWSIEAIIRERLFLDRRAVIPYVTVGALAVALNILAGHVEITIYTLLIAGYFAAGRLLFTLWQERAWSLIIRKGAWLLAMVGLGIGLAGVQFIPLLEFVNDNWRAERADIATVLSYAHPERDILQYAMPNFYGNPAHQRIFDWFSFEFRPVPSEGQVHTDWGEKNYVEAALYVGILPLLFAIYALWDRVVRWRSSEAPPAFVRREPPYRLLFALLGLVSLTFMFGWPTYRLLYALPGINQLNTPFRWVYGVVVAVSLLAGFGFDALRRRAAERRNPQEIRLGILTLIASGVMFVGLLLVYLAFPVIEPFIADVLDRLAHARRAFSGNIPDAEALFFSYQMTNALVFIVMLAASGVLMLWIGLMRGYRSLPLWSGLALALAVLDLFSASWGFNPAVDPALLDFEPPVVQFLREQQAEEGAFRYTTLEDPSQGAILRANVTMQYGLDDMRGYDSIIPAAYVNAMRDLAPQYELNANRIAPLRTSDDFASSLNAPLFHLLNVRYVVTHKTIFLPFADWPLVYEDEAVRVWQNPQAVPRAFFVRADDFPQGWLPHNDQPPPRDADPAAVIPPYEAVTITQDTGREKFVTLALDQPGWLVVSENYRNGWRAYLRRAGSAQEEARLVEPVAGILQGVRVPAGEYTVRLVYSPQSVQIGFFTSAISTALLGFLVGAWAWRTFVGVNDEHTAGTTRVARNSVAPIVLNLFNRGVDFVFAIIFYRLVSQELVGIYNFAANVFLWFEIFMNFGLDLYLIREVSRDKARSTYYLVNTSIVRAGLSVLGIGLLALFLLAWQNGVAEPLPPEGLWTLALLYVGLFPATLSKGLTGLFYAHEQAEVPAAIATATTISKVIFGVIVLLLGWGIVGLAAVSVGNNLLTLALLLWQGRGFIQRPFTLRPDRQLMGEMMAESRPLLFNHFLQVIFFQVDIVILQGLRGAVTVAEYSTSYKWLLALNVIPSFFTQALFPGLSRQAKEDPEKFLLTYRFGLKLLLATALPAAVLVTLLARPLTLLLAGEAYIPNGVIALQIMIWSIPFGWMNSLTQYALIALDLQRFITRAFLLAVTFNIVSNLIFIPLYGFQAAAVTTILSEAILLVPFGLLMQRGLARPLPWLGWLWRPLVAAGGMIVAAILLDAWPLLLRVPAVSLVYVVLLVLLNPLDDDEWATVDSLIPQPLRRLALLRGS